jgi:hypothetical protein
MFHILAVGFYCQIYKNKPNIRIFLNNNFIDDFFIEHHDFTNHSTLPNLNFYKINLLEDRHVQSIKLQVTNSDSNYNNGFMTKSTLIKFHTCCLVPNDDYQYVLNKINSGKTLDHMEADMKVYNLIPYLNWQENDKIIENPLHLTIGGSKVFTIDLYQHCTVYKPKAKLPSSIAKNLI